MRALRSLTALGLLAALMVASPASAATTVKIVAADGTWLNHTVQTNYGMMAVVGGPGWGCGGASVTPGKFAGGAAGASCNTTGGTVVYMARGEWWVDYP